MNQFTFSNDNKRYHTLNFYNLNRFGKRIVKASVDAGMTCPNIDGTKGVGGCSFCLGGSSYFSDGTISITGQLQLENERIAKKYNDYSLCAYFQAHTNTYAPAEKLKSVYDEALAFKNVAALSIATRPDCLDEKTTELLSYYAEKTALTVELGLQTIHDETAREFNRCSLLEDFERAFWLLRERKIRVCVHIINGLMSETREMMLETADYLAGLRVDAVKIQLLHILEGTPYAGLYRNGKIKPLSMDEYVDITVSQLELLPPETVIERLTGDGNKKALLAPLWSARKIAVLSAIDKKAAERNTFQGRLFRGSAQL